MLDFIRNKQKSAVVKLVFWAIIATFVGTIFLVWGKGSDRGGQATVVASIDGSDVSYEDYQTAYSNLYRLYQSIYREQFTPALEKQLGLRKQALEGLIEERLLLAEAKRLKLKVSQDELVDSIAKIAAFQDNGRFSKERYLQVLSYQRLTPEEFEVQQRQQLLVQKVRDQLTGDLSVSEEEILEEYRNESEKANLSFVSLAPALFESRVEVKDEELQAFFDENREDFRTPDMVALRYLLFEPDSYLKEVSLSEEEMEKYYRRHLDRFEIPEQVDASHILIKVDADADDAARQKKRELVEKVLAEAKAGKDFAELVRSYSDDAGSVSQGGRLGYFTRGTMVAPFENAAFSLEPGELSGIVETTFGYHIIRCEGVIEPGVKPLADVIDEVKEGLRAEKAEKLALEKAMDAYNINRKSGDLDAAAAANDLGVKETNFFAAGESIDGIGNAPEIAQGALALPAGELARPVVMPQGIYLYALKERRDSRLPELDEVRNAAEEAFRQSRGADLAKETAEAILAEIKAGSSLAKVAQKHKLKVDESGEFARSYGGFIPRLGNAEELSKQAFELTEEAPLLPEVAEIAGKFIVATLKERKAADPAGLDDERRKTLRDSLENKKKQDNLTKQLEQLREQADIMVAPAFAADLKEG